MRKWLFSLFLVLFIGIGFSHLYARQQRVLRTTTPDPLVQEMISKVSGDSILANVRRLESFGTRYETSLQRDSAATSILNSLKGTGYTIESDTLYYCLADYRALVNWGKFTFWVIGQDTRNKQNYLLHTINRGLKWTLQSPPKAVDLTAICFVDSAIGWIAGSNGGIFKSTDSGTTWQQQFTGISALLNDIGFVNNQVGIAIGDEGTLLRTKDGGLNWTSVNWGGTSDLKRLRVVTKQEMWAAGSAGVILHSTDGGVSWDKQHSGISSDLVSMDFADSLRGWVFGPMATLLRTIDGGQGWNAVSVPSDMKRDSSGAQQDVCVIDSMSALITSVNEIWKTSDGGGTWKRMANVGSRFVRVWRGDSLLTYGGVAGIYWSANGGSTWQAWDANVPRSLYGTSRNCVATISGLITPEKEYLIVAHYDTPPGNDPGADDNASGVAAAMEAIRVLKGYQFESTIRFVATSGEQTGLLGSNHYADLAKSLGRNIVLVANLDMLGYPVVGDTTRIVVGSYERRSAFVDSVLAYNSTYGLGMRIDPFIDPAGEGDTYSFDFAGYETLHFSEGTSKEILQGNPYAFKPTDTSDKLNQGMLIRAARLIVCVAASLGKHIEPHQEVWTWKIPYMHWNDLNGIAVVNSNTIYAVGDIGTIIRTTDGGRNWIQQSTGISTPLRGVWFTDQNHGFAVGDQGSLLRTTNGGVTWSIKILDSTSAFYGVCFNDLNTGCIVGTNGAFYQTYDGGATWTRRIITSAIKITAVTFRDKFNGVFVGEFGTIFRTTDGGSNWTREVSGVESYQGPSLLGVAFVDPNTAVAVGDYGIILRTTNGGANWRLQLELGTRAYIHAVHFLDSQTGYAVCDGGVIIVSTDGGLTWAEQFTAGTSWLSAIRFVDSKNGFAVGTQGFLLRTTDGGATWVNEAGGPRMSLYGVHFTNAAVGVVVGYLGSIYRTIDGGVSWKQLSSGTTSTLRGLDFSNSNVGVAVGDFGTILRTTDAGVTWKDLTIIDAVKGSTLMFNAISMPTSSTGIIVGRIDSLVGAQMITRSLILRSVDAGQNWVRIPPPLPNNRELLGVAFGGITTATAVGDTGLIIHSTNAGLSWYAQSGIPDHERGDTVPSPNNRLMGVAFSGPSKGFVVGTAGTILITSDGGASWSKRPSPTFEALYAASTIDGVHVLAVGSAGAVIVSSTSGFSWGGSTTETTQSLYAAHFTDVDRGTIVGNSGVVLRTPLAIATGIPQWEPAAHPPNQFVLNQNYPNPFNGTTTISYQVPALNQVSLKVYDLLGREVATLVHGVEPPGLFVVRWNSNSLPSGVYFYRLVIGDFQMTKKMMLLK